MKRHTIFCLVGALLITGGLLLSLGSHTHAAPPLPPPFAGSDVPIRYFGHTGHYVVGPFLEFFNRYGGLRIFGYPQTELFYDARIGLWVQFFDNARMEWHPENPDPYKVQLGLLGDILGYRRPPIPANRRPPDTPFRRYFPETGHVVSFAFLDFYNRNGGLDIFGYPISEPMIEDGYIVQYFQRMRMEWHPEQPRNNRVVLSPLGREYIYRFGVPAECLRRRPPRENISTDFPISGEEATLRAWVTLQDMVISIGETQTLSVYVTDRERKPVAEAQVTVTVHYPSGQQVFSLPPTDQRGITQVSFLVPPARLGERVVVEVTVEYWGVKTTTETFFLLW
ncbi:MAG TPA: hypothetical protein G4O00_00780 [Thermoflexia bacterium]|jgi:hypothetical protein|nr:hypothetical protein [Thermoflexia bacterium]